MTQGKGSRRRPSPLSRADQDSAWARTFPTREDREVIWAAVEISRHGTLRLDGEVVDTVPPGVCPWVGIRAAESTQPEPEEER